MRRRKASVVPAFAAIDLRSACSSFCLARQQRRILQSGKLSAIDLQSVLNAVEFVLRLTCLLFTHRHVFLEHRFTPFQQADDDRDARVAQLLEVRNGIETRG